MADWPANGAENWNTKMKANIDVGHDSDGTHKKSQMLTDMEWSPTTYAGGESVTFPNGLILKQGSEAVDANTTDDITYGVAFPTGVKSVSASYVTADATIDQPVSVRRKPGEENTVLQVTNGDSAGARNIDWQVWGH